MAQREIEILTRDQCYELLASEVVGRLVFVDEEGPGAVPVNYGLADDEIFFRVEPTSHLREAVPNVGFEVDHTDAETGSGWSVLVRGEAMEVELESVPDLLRESHGKFPRPWAEGVHNVWVSIKPRLVTGKRLTGPYFGDVL